MISLITLIIAVCELAFPTFMLMLVYPFSKKAAMFWSNYITDYCAKSVFSILKCYRHFDFSGDEESKKNLPEQFVIVSNHQSLIDIVVYLRYFCGQRKVRFVAKDALEKIPMVGKMLKTQGHCMIPRKGSPTVAMKSIDSFGKRALEQNMCPVIFPEGTRSRDGELRSFYAAGFRRLCQSTNLPVVVCALDGGWKIGNLKTIFKNLHRGEYKVKVLKIFDAPKNKEEEVKILEEAPVLIQNQLNEWRS